MAEKEQLLLRAMPPELKLALMKAAEYAETNMQSIAVGILAEEFKFEYKPGHYRGNSPDETNLTMNLRMPPELHKRLRIAAAEEGIAYSDMAVKVIAKKLGVEIPAEYLNRRGRRPDTAAA